MFNSIIKNKEKDNKRYQDNITTIGNKIMDLVEENQVNPDEMSDILLYLSSNYQKSLLDLIKQNVK